MASSSTTEPSPTENSRKSSLVAHNFIPQNYCVLLSSCQNPFLMIRDRQPFFFKPNNINIMLPSPNCMLRDLHTSLTSTADKCFKLLQQFASQNPILNKLLSFSSDFHKHLNAHQVECRAFRNTNSVSKHKFAAVLPGDSVAGIVVANGILNFLNIYNTLLIIRLVLTWFPNSPPAIVSPLSTLCDPYLNIFRGIIPPLGGTLDLSPILAFLVLNAFTSTAAALPAELPKPGETTIPPHSTLSSLTSSQKKWMRRLSGNKPHSSTGAH